MLIGRYRPSSEKLDQLANRSKLWIVLLFVALLLLIYTSTYIKYQNRKKAEGPSLNEVVNQGSKWTIINDEAEDSPQSAPPASTTK